MANDEEFAELIDNLEEELYEAHQAIDALEAIIKRKDAELERLEAELRKCKCHPCACPPDLSPSASR